MRPYRGREVVCYHKQFEYLLHWLGLVAVGYIEKREALGFPLLAGAEKKRSGA